MVATKQWKLARSLLLGCGLALCCAPNAGGQTTESDRVSLSGDWQFKLGPDLKAAETLARFYEPGFDAHAFRTLPVPSNWSLHGFEEPLFTQAFPGEGRKYLLPPPPDSEGFYLHRFQVATDARDKRVVLHFDGVWQSAEVWLNGFRLGRHDGGFTAFAFEAGGALRPGADNLLAVRVRQNTKDAMLDVNDDWALGGIYRDVWLEFTPRELYLDRVQAVTDFDAAFRDATLHLRMFVGNQTPAARAFQVRARLTDQNGRKVQSATSEVPSQTCGFAACGREVKIDLPVARPAQWTAETPVLYGLQVDLILNGQIIHSRTDRVGFREVSTTGGVLRINGRPVKLRGVCRHDEHPDVGRATQREHWLQDIRLMKEANINAVRTSHYPPAEGFLRLCDELGLYVIDEVPMGFGGDLLLDSSFAASVLQRAHETIMRDYNRPSVIIWSIGNEDPLTDLHLAAVKYIKGTDLSRPILLPWNADESLPSEIDILAPHYESAEVLDRMAKETKRPVITTEYSHALGDQDFGGLEDRWRALTRHPAGAGGMIWLWADQGIKRSLNGRVPLDPLADLGKYKARGTELVRHSDVAPGEIYDAHGVFGTDGIVNPDRSPQRDYWETKAVYAPVTVLVKEIVLTGNKQSVQIPMRNDHDFVDLNTVTINWRLMADEKELARGAERLNAVPGATAMANVPTSALTKTEKDQSYYVQLVFNRVDGSEMARRSVRLTSGAESVESASRVRGSNKLQVIKRGSKLVVHAARTRFEFDQESGRIVNASAGGSPLFSNLRATIWRPFSLSEKRLFRGDDNLDRPPAPDLTRFTTKVLHWVVSESKETVDIRVEAEHQIDEKNSFLVSYHYQFSRAGKLHIEYTIAPRVQVKWLPEVGLEMIVAPQLEELRWVGLGPLDSYPNKKAAVSFGAWRAHFGSAASLGIKSEVRWAEVSGQSGPGFRITGSPFIRLSGNRDPTTLRALTAVVGRSAKFTGPERQSDKLEVAADTVFKGSFTIELDR